MICNVLFSRRTHIGILASEALKTAALQSQWSQNTVQDLGRNVLLWGVERLVAVGVHESGAVFWAEGQVSADGSGRHRSGLPGVASDCLQAFPDLLMLQVHAQEAGRLARQAVDACWLPDVAAHSESALVCLEAVKAAAGHGRVVHLPKELSDLLHRGKGWRSDVHLPARHSSMPPVSITLDACQSYSKRSKSRGLGEEAIAHLSGLGMLQYKMVDLLKDVVCISPIVVAKDSIFSHCLTSASFGVSSGSIPAGNGLRHDIDQQNDKQQMTRTTH